MCQRKEHKDQEIHKDNPKFETGQLVMVKNHICHNFELNYLLDHRVLKILYDSTLLLATPSGKEKKTNVNDVKHCS